MDPKPNNEDSLVWEEDADSPSLKRQKVDGDGNSSSSVSAGSDSEWAEYRVFPGKEPPEWRVDSYDDGREFKINLRIRRLYKTQERYDEYYQERLRSFQSKGFLPDPWSEIYETYLDKDYRKFVEELTNVCVKKFNDTNQGKTNLELVDVVRANESGLDHLKLYITFMAREYRGGALVEYQAKVIKYFGKVKPPFPILCRPAPTTGP